MRKGVPISPVVAVAPADCVDQVLARREPQQLDEGLLSAEVTRFTAAVRAAAEELDAIVARVTQQLGEEEAAIFRAHRLLLRDPNLIGKVKTVILTRHVDAGTGLNEVVEEYTSLLSEIPDQYIRERMADIRDVAGRILAQLSLRDGCHKLNLEEPVIIVAPEILPSQALTFDRLQVAGILTETGGTTGHAAILARSLGIPAVSGLRGLTREVRSGDLIALDGRE